MPAKAQNKPLGHKSNKKDINPHNARLGLRRLFNGPAKQTGYRIPEIVICFFKEAFDLAKGHIKVALKFPFDTKVGEKDLYGLSKTQLQVYKALHNDPFIAIKGLEPIVELKQSRIACFKKSLGN